MKQGRRPLPPYVAYRTFTNYLAELRSRGIPSRIDRTALPHRSGAVQSQLLLALEYLGLIDADRRPSDRLRDLVEAEGADRRRQLRELLGSAYSFLTDDELDLATATSQQLEELFAATGTSGETLRRAQSFFLAMAREAGLTVSRYIKPHRGRRKSARPATSTREPPSPSAPAVPAVPAARAIHRSVALPGGGVLTLSFDGNIFQLDSADREFVFGLVDTLTTYEREIDRRDS